MKHPDLVIGQRYVLPGRNQYTLDHLAPTYAVWIGDDGHQLLTPPDVEVSPASLTLELGKTYEDCKGRRYYVYEIDGHHTHPVNVVGEDRTGYSTTLTGKSHYGSLLDLIRESQNPYDPGPQLQVGKSYRGVRITRKTESNHTFRKYHGDNGNSYTAYGESPAGDNLDPSEPDDLIQVGKHYVTRGGRVVKAIRVMDTPWIMFDDGMSRNRDTGRYLPHTQTSTYDIVKEVVTLETRDLT